MPGGEGSEPCWSPPGWPSDAGCVGGLAGDGGSGGGWLGAWIGGWLLEWRLGVAHGWKVGEVGEWLDKGPGLGLREWDEPEEEAAWVTELQGWLGGGFIGLGGAGACFLVPGTLRMVCGLGPMDPAPGDPVPSCPAACPTAPEPFLWSSGVGPAVRSRCFGLLSSSVCWARSC